MIPPYELEGKSFKRVMKGYQPSEVDEHIDFMIRKYKELYRAYSELEKSYTEMRTEFLQYKENENAIRRTLDRSRVEGDQMIRRAEERSEMILKTARDECDAILEDFKVRVREQERILSECQRQVTAFKTLIFSQYQRHIEYLEEIAPEAKTLSGSEAEAIIGGTIGTIIARAKHLIREEDNLGPTISADELPPSGSDGLQSDPEEHEISDEPVNESPDEFQVVDLGGFGEENVEKVADGDTMKFRVISDLPPDIAGAENILFD